ncbi:hypothetical protein PENNAL_c0038G07912 [Penicillium nalgiovense]|uniref:Uncharacterized protein n=1 Tax=Penicillium nalgiovense TaxID=60175 RepID=A0A1V6Y3U8_PENNA|nr:hypothetical protein PENNAL_c0038G07912 [Penicillium nalgiovense]
MASEDPIDLAQTAISRVADIASSLGVEYKRPVCGRLGAELLLVANYIDTTGLDQEKCRRLFPSCYVMWKVSAIWDIGHTIPGCSVYNRAQTKIQRGLTCLTEKPRHAEQVIVHIQRFTKGDRKSNKRDVGDKTSKKGWSHPERPRYANELVHRTSREYVRCTCQESEVK